MASFGLLVILLAIVVAGSALQAREQSDALSEIQENTTVVDLIQHAEQQHRQGILLLETYVASGDEETIPDVRSSLSRASDSINMAHLIEGTDTGFTAGIDAEEEVARLREILATMAASSVIVEGTITARERGDIEGAEELLAANLPRIIGLSALIEEGVEDELTEVSFLQGRSNDLANLTFWLLLATGAVSAILIAGAAVIIGRSILKPLSALESAALAVAGGDLEARAPVSGPQELARLGVSFNQMTESLLKDITERRRAEEDLRLQSEMMKNMAEAVYLVRASD